MFFDEQIRTIAVFAAFFAIIALVSYIYRVLYRHFSPVKYTVNKIARRMGDCMVVDGQIIGGIMRHFIFCDNETGEEFIVGAESLEKAWQIAKEYFFEPEFCSECSDMEAEMSGLDEY